MFQRYARAYQVLSDSEMRINYDYLLDHPMEFPMHYLRFGSGTYQPKSDVRFVLLLVILGVSGTQLLYQKQRRLNALQGVKTTRTYSERLKSLTAEFSKAGKGGKPVSSGSAKGKKEAVKGKDGDSEAKKMAEAKLLEEIEQSLPGEASYKDTAAFFIFTLPLTSCYGMYGMAMWVINFKLLGKEYGPAEQDYLTRKAVGCTKAEWKKVPEEEKAALLEQELWITENKEAYDAEIDAAASKGSPTRSNKDKRAIRQKKKPSEPMVMMD